MNNYMKSILKLVDESLCEKYTLNYNAENAKYNICDIKNILKYRFGLDFDKDMEMILVNHSALKSGGNVCLVKLFKSMITILNEKILPDEFNHDKLRFSMLKRVIEDMDSDTYINNIIYYLLCNLYQIVININNDVYHNYADFSECFIGYESVFKFKSTKDIFNADKLVCNGRENYKDSFFHSLFASRNVVENESKLNEKYERSEEDDEEYKEEQSPEEFLDYLKELKEESLNKANEIKNESKKKIHQWCEANDGACISTVYTANLSPFACKYSLNKKEYTYKRYYDFNEEYILTLKNVMRYNKQRGKLNYAKYWYTSSGCKFYNEEYSALFFSDLIYGFSSINKILNCIKKNRNTITQEDQLPKIIRKILNIGSEIMLIPDVLNRNVLAEKIANYIFNPEVKTKHIEVLSDDIKTFCYYQSKVYYYIITTYALLMIDFILCNQNEDISENKEKSEEYVRKIIHLGLKHYRKINLKCKKYDDNDQYVNLSSFYKNLRYEFYTKNNFDKYFGTNLFSDEIDTNDILKCFFLNMIQEDNDENYFI